MTDDNKPTTSFTCPTLNGQDEGSASPAPPRISGGAVDRR
jgi:hypothetical protein